MKTKTLFNRRERIFLLILTILVVVALMFIFWKSNPQQHQPPLSTKDWVTYSDQDIPFTFSHPQNWTIIKSRPDYRTVFTANDRTNNEFILSVAYGNPPGLAAGVSACQGYVESTKCSYINNPLVDNFFHVEGDTTWRSNKEYKGEDIVLTLIKRNQTSRDILIKLGESIRAQE